MASVCDAEPVVGLIMPRLQERGAVELVARDQHHQGVFAAPSWCNTRECAVELLILHRR